MSLTRRHLLATAGAVAGAALLPGQAPPPRFQPPALPVSEATRRRKKIDFHTHLGSTNPEIYNLPKENIGKACDVLLRQMEQFNVERAMLVPVEPIMKTEYYAEAARLHPGKFVFAAGTTVRPLNQALDSLHKWADAGARALKMNPLTYSPGDEAAERLVVEAVKLKLPVLFHHRDVPPDVPQFIYHLATRYPEGTYVVIHFGGNWGFLQAMPLATNLPNVYLETSPDFPALVRSPAKGMLEHFDKVGARSGFHKCFFGSEYVEQYPNVLGAIDSLNLAPEVLDNLFYENAKRILKL
jgi:predicted TIM-barrel fold metal-dependent hydrolase